MKDTFQCTPELLCEFFDSLPRGSSVGDIFYYWDKFKSSKAPKKEWEIVAFKEQAGIAIYNLKDDGMYRCVDFPHQRGYSLKQMLEDRDTIVSVRRLSDDIIFSCQETVDTPSDGRRVIEGFEIDGGDLLVKMGRGFIGFSAIKKLPDPVLVTTDGAEIFPGDKYWMVYPDWDYRELVADQRDKVRGYDIFSTREAAETYILQNRPLLSLNDVKEAANATVKDYWLLMEALSIKVKQKLNP